METPLKPALPARRGAPSSQPGIVMAAVTSGVMLLDWDDEDEVTNEHPSASPRVIYKGELDVRMPAPAPPPSSGGGLFDPRARIVQPVITDLPPSRIVIRTPSAMSPAPVRTAPLPAPALPRMSAPPIPPPRDARSTLVGLAPAVVGGSTSTAALRALPPPARPPLPAPALPAPALPAPARLAPAAPVALAPPSLARPVVSGAATTLPPPLPARPAPAPLPPPPRRTVAAEGTSMRATHMGLFGVRPPVESAPVAPVDAGARVRSPSLGRVVPPGPEVPAVPQQVAPQQVAPLQVAPPQVVPPQRALPIAPPQVVPKHVAPPQRALPIAPPPLPAAMRELDDDAVATRVRRPLSDEEATNVLDDPRLAHPRAALPAPTDALPEPARAIVAESAAPAAPPQTPGSDHVAQPVAPAVPPETRASHHVVAEAAAPAAPPATPASHHVVAEPVAPATPPQTRGADRELPTLFDDFDDEEEGNAARPDAELPVTRVVHDDAIDVDVDDPADDAPAVDSSAGVPELTAPDAEGVELTPAWTRASAVEDSSVHLLPSLEDDPVLALEQALRRAGLSADGLRPDLDDTPALALDGEADESELDRPDSHRAPPARASDDGTPLPLLARRARRPLAPPAEESRPVALPLLRRKARELGEKSRGKVGAASPSGSLWPVSMVTPANPLRARRRRTPLWLGAAAALVAVLGATWALVPGEGSLRVDIDRAVGAQRAEVFVDGAKRCDTTPCVVELPPGKKVVKVVADGFTPVSVESAEVSARAETRLTVRLEPEVLHQGVFARADQAGVRVAIDGDDAGPLPLKHTSLPAGEHRLRFFGDGYRSLEKVVTVQRGELLDLGVVRLAIDEPKLTLELATPGATVVVRQTVDGRVTGRRVVGPWPRELELKPGRYEVVATRAGYQTAVLPVRFDEGDARQALVVRLSPLGATRLPVASAPPTAPAAVSRAADVFAGRQ